MRHVWRLPLGWAGNRWSRTASLLRPCLNRRTECSKTKIKKRIDRIPSAGLRYRKQPRATSEAMDPRHSRAGGHDFHHRRAMAQCRFIIDRFGCRPLEIPGGRAWIQMSRTKARVMAERAGSRASSEERSMVRFRRFGTVRDVASSR